MGKKETLYAIHTYDRENTLSIIVIEKKEQQNGLEMCG